jgi:hypothetical protein
LDELGNWSRNIFGIFLDSFAEEIAQMGQLGTIAALAVVGVFILFEIIDCIRYRR